jgi:hypothetical protein
MCLVAGDLKSIDRWEMLLGGLGGRAEYMQTAWFKYLIP